MFGKKNDCPKCRSAIKDSFDFCPYCGCDVSNPEKDMRDYGLLGKHEFSESAPMIGGGSMGISDKIFQSLFNQIAKALEAQMRNAGAGEADVSELPHGLQITVGGKPRQPRQRKQRVLSEEQLKRMAGVPRVEAKTDIRRLSDKVVYEMKASDISSINDIFVSKVESGYEVKAIGKNKVYVNSLQVDLPLKSYALTEKGVSLEFGLQ